MLLQLFLFSAADAAVMVGVWLLDALVVLVLVGRYRVPVTSSDHGAGVCLFVSLFRTSYMSIPKLSVYHVYLSIYLSINLSIYLPILS